MSGDGWKRVIAHADMDAFYAAVEQRDNPELRGRPLLVGGIGRRGVVSTASYEARLFGCGSAMPMAEARRRCPEAVVLPPDFERYRAVSGRIMEVFQRCSPLVEPLSLDEAFIDLSGTRGLLGTPEEAARRIKRDVLRETEGLTVSVGVSATKFVAKVASDHDKPDGLTIVPPDRVESFLRPLPVSRLWGVGPRARERLEAQGLRSMGEVADASPELLQRRLGSLGDHISALARGIDPRPVVPHRDPRSVGAEVTLEEDVTGRESALVHLRRCADRAARRLRRKRVLAGGVRLKLRTAKFRTLSRQVGLSRPADSSAELLAAVEEMLDQLDLGEPMRLVGLAAFDLVPADAGVQIELFSDGERDRRRRLDRTVDELKDRYGDDVIRRGDD
jgi:DNA polymerase IV